MHVSIRTVSTDKAVNPPNIMGATKRLCEMIQQDMATRSEYTKFACGSFRECIRSRGSVIPLFKKQIAEGDQLATHPAVRYFMTDGELPQLVIQAGALLVAGNLRVGQPVKIVDLAKNLIRLSY